MALSTADREMLVRLVPTGSNPAQQVRRARILLELDACPRWCARFTQLPKVPSFTPRSRATCAIGFLVSSTK